MKRNDFLFVRIASLLFFLVPVCLKSATRPRAFLIYVQNVECPFCARKAMNVVEKAGFCNVRYVCSEGSLEAGHIEADWEHRRGNPLLEQLNKELTGLSFPIRLVQGECYGSFIGKETFLADTGSGKQRHEHAKRGRSRRYAVLEVQFNPAE